ncbi:aspartic peptidase domain-containing protein [Hygrophoropsis aurantiaca]|uniref:Aspartic peptidase domain-containing protein n=1 Tax=Hygrophoropsis aurantiaca TaxID=72124 RepID=A0ACB8A1B2_9AGAM|nr:aspartic peptidase domain-containing protein [Hygrophoropsis aurantiaca]
MTVLADVKSPSRKGKERASFDSRSEGTGGSGGIVLSMEMVSTSYFGVAYTIPVFVGATQQNLSLQVDTGSSDLWIAAQSCSSSTCASTNGHLYDPSSSTSTGQTFEINYLLGTVSGPIVWDEISIGNYDILNQALAAATSVNNEPLSYDFDGILGLALPLNSVISEQLPPDTNDIADGATLPSNLFSMTPTSSAPASPFFSLVLARPGSSELPSLLGIGLHPSDIIPDPSKINYSPIVSEQEGMLWWKTSVQAITVYVNSQPKTITLGQSITGAAYPTAVLDSGLPLILTTSEIANAVYGALGISPGANGQYYVPCTTPLNMSITLDGQPEIPLHPLDLTVEPSGQSGAQYCIGLIQAADAALTPTSDIGDMILGVPFMRNVYTVMAYETPDASGAYNASVHNGIHPALGLLGLTNATQAMEDFHKVRVLQQPLDGGQTQLSATDSKKMSVGIDVLIGLVGFFALCIGLFGLRCFLTRRQFNKRTAMGQRDGVADQKAAYQLTRRNSRSSVDDIPQYTLQTLAYHSYKREDKIVSQYTVDSARTRVGVEHGDIEFGVRKKRRDDADLPVFDLSDPWDPHNSISWRDTIVGTDAPQSCPPSPEFPPPELPPKHARSPSELQGAPASVSVPLLAHRHTRSDSQNSYGDLAEFGFVLDGPSMAGIGTAARGSQIGAGMRHSRAGSDDSTNRQSLSLSPLRFSSLSSPPIQPPPELEQDPHTHHDTEAVHEEVR